MELVLTDNAPVLLAAERLRPFYPNLLAVSNPWVATGTTGERASQLKGKDEATVFSTFLKEVCQTEPTPGDLELFREILGDIQGEG